MPRMTLARCPRCSFHHRTRQPAPLMPRTRFSAAIKMTPELVCARCRHDAKRAAKRTAKQLAQDGVGQAVGEVLARFYTCQ